MNSKYGAQNKQVNGKKHDKIELVNCPRGGLNCKSHLAEINRLFIESENYQQNKEYQFSIRYLRKAFEETYQLKQFTCVKCADAFRLEIIASLENIHSEIKKLSRGFFIKKNRYKMSLELVQQTLSDLKEKQKELQAEGDKVLQAKT